MRIPILEINHTCSTTCKYRSTSDSNYWKMVYNWWPKNPYCPSVFFWFPVTPQFSTTCTWTWHDELLSYTDFQASFNWFKIILLVDSSVIMGSHQPLLLWHLVFYMQGLILGPHLFPILLTIIILTKCFYHLAAILSSMLMIFLLYCPISSPAD